MKHEIKPHNKAFKYTFVEKKYVKFNLLSDGKSKIYKNKRQ